MFLRKKGERYTKDVDCLFIVKFNPISVHFIKCMTQQNKYLEDFSVYSCMNVV